MEVYKFKKEDIFKKPTIDNTDNIDFYEKYIEPKDSEKHLQSWYDEDNKCDHLVEETYKQIWLSFNDVKWEELGDTIINTIQENYDLINVDGFYKKSKHTSKYVQIRKNTYFPKTCPWHDRVLTQL